MKSEINHPSLENSSKISGEDEKIVCYSRNVFLPVTNLCRNKCSYCGFRKEPERGAWIMSKEEVLDLALRGKKAGCSEALITLGERPEVYKIARGKLDESGYGSFADYLVDLSREILAHGLLPHTNSGILSKNELSRLRKWNASMGLMLECATDLPAHEKSPGKDPSTRLRMMKKAGELKIPFTTGILIGIGEGLRDRIKSLLEIRKLQEKYGHIQEVIIQPFVPKEGTPMENESPPSHLEILNTVSLARSIMPEMNIQVPPNLTSNIADFLRAGVNDLGGISEVTPDFINPKRSWPSISDLKSELDKAGFELKERLPIYPEFAKSSNFLSSEVKKVVKDLSDPEGYRGK